MISTTNLKFTPESEFRIEVKKKNMTMEILGSFMVRRNSFGSYNQLFHDLSTCTSLLNLGKRRLQIGKRTVPTSPVLITDDKSVEARAQVPRQVKMIPVTRPLQMEADSEMPVPLKMTALVTVRHQKMELLGTMFRPLDDFITPSQKGVVLLQLVSADADPRTMQPYLSNKATLRWSKTFDTEPTPVTYKVDLLVGSNFGTPGAIMVSNKYQKEFYLESVVVEGIFQFACNSWVQPDKINADKRIFFTNKAYLPCQTPLGIKLIRKMELQQLRGDGKGIRTLSDRIYDYEVYNDLGNPDAGLECARLTLGGESHPYPRRCKTERPPNNTDSNTESPVNASTPMYVPRDEAFNDSRREDMHADRLKLLLNNLIPTLRSVCNGDFVKSFSDLHCLYKERTHKNSENELSENLPFWFNLGMLPKIIQEALKFNPPKAISKGSCFCLRDDEFGRLALAGINPLSIERLKVFPPVSKLDSSVYGPRKSALGEEHIVDHLNGISVQQALEENKLFIIDYHDAYLPFLDRINALGDRKAYATRTIFFLTPLGTLKPIAIELSLPSEKQVLTPPVDATTNWLWQLGKAHVSSNDAGAHQLIHHWLRTHACIEPIIIAAHRRLSRMHPVHKLLQPHLRYTLEINAQARQYLVNAGGIIESFFAPGKHGMEISVSAYRDWWRFDMEGLPADLIRRGMATPAPTEPHGIRLIIEDYPYGSDGLLIWSAIETLVHSYVHHYYCDASQVMSDMEIQAWYSECINVGHADLRHASWWPKLSTTDDLASILTTIIWIVSAQHAAINFGQYPYGGYVPIRPPLMRRLVPKEPDPEYADFLKDPEKYYLSTLPTLRQASHYISVLHILSTHTLDEEYLGERELSSWSGEPEIIEAFYKFSTELKRIEKIIEKRNADPNLRNRCGAGVPPYELLMPSSGPGMSCRGVPNSVTI